MPKIRTVAEIFEWTDELLEGPFAANEQTRGLAYLAMCCAIADTTRHLQTLDASDAQQAVSAMNRDAMQRLGVVMDALNANTPPAKILRLVWSDSTNSKTTS